MPNVYFLINIPLYLIAAFTYLFIYLGLSFFSAIAVFILGFFTNLFLCLGEAKNWGLYLNEKDKRMKLTTEALFNIKIVKLYSWSKQFFDKIVNARK